MSQAFRASPQQLDAMIVAGTLCEQCGTSAAQGGRVWHGAGWRARNYINIPRKIKSLGSLLTSFVSVFLSYRWINSFSAAGLA